MGKPNDLRQAVGRLIVGRIEGEELDDDTSDVLEKGIMGGVVLFKENAKDLEQLSCLIGSISMRTSWEPLIAVDQEGGSVQRFDHILTPLSSAMALSALNDPHEAACIAHLSAKQLKLLGVNCVLSPVLDVLTNPLNPIIGTRSFGSNPAQVRELGMVVTKSLTDEGIIAVGKHFPGHGDTIEDSHLHLAVNKRGAKELWQQELVPFRACVQYSPAMMTGHIWSCAIDEKPLPASLSYRVTTGLLRQYLGFAGLVFTDDLLMKGIADNWELEEAAVLALAAGADQLLVLGKPSQVKSVHKALMKAVKSGRIHESQLAKSKDRLEKALTITGQLTEQPKSRLERLHELKQLLSVDHDTSLKAASRAISCLRGNIPDLTSGWWVIVTPDLPRYALNLEQYLVKYSKQLLKAGKIQLKQVRYLPDPTTEEIAVVAEQCKGQGCIYLTYRSLLNQGQIKLGKSLAEVCKDKIAIACDVPYDLMGLPDWDNCLATFDPSDLAVEALSLVLLGQHLPSGLCPVNLQVVV
ncbi:MAG: beta-N-acetylhexosaminidase [Candidatus Melainabacteria bacterium]|nr:beta-N-acetylhexosaminidase [Candidatus Melainabacteria bacterium]